MNQQGAVNKQQKITGYRKNEEVHKMQYLYHSNSVHCITNDSYNTRDRGNNRKHKISSVVLKCASIKVIEQGPIMSLLSSIDIALCINNMNTKSTLTFLGTIRAILQAYKHNQANKQSKHTNTCFKNSMLYSTFKNKLRLRSQTRTSNYWGHRGFIQL